MKMNEAVHEAVDRDVYGAVLDVVGGVVDGAAYQIVYNAVGWAVFEAGGSTMDNAVYRATHNDPQHPALFDFLAGAGDDQAAT